MKIRSVLKLLVFTKSSSEKDIANSHHKNSYVIKVNFMHGDSDSYSSLEKSFDMRHSEMLDFANFLNMCLYHYPFGLNGESSYCTIPGYEVHGESFFPRDLHYQNNEATLETYEVFWYDYKGLPHNVNLS